MPVVGYGRLAMRRLLPALATLLLACDSEPDGVECDVLWASGAETVVMVDAEDEYEAGSICNRPSPDDHLEWPHYTRAPMCFVWAYEDGTVPEGNPAAAFIQGETDVPPCSCDCIG